MVDVSEDGRRVRKMYLYVEFADIWNAWNAAQMGFNTTTSSRRIKKIRLTDEQIAELQPKEVGTNGGVKVHEYVSVLCIQED